jgi:hypothetical protein
MPLVNSVSLEGEILRLQMKPAPGKSQGEMPSLVMQARGQRFEGAWMLDGVALGPVMKLVRRPTA